MRQAIIDIQGNMLGHAAAVLADAGLKITASFHHGFDNGYALDAVRVLLEDEFDRILPEECNHYGRGTWHLVRAIFQQEAYGNQRLTRLSAIEIAGQLIFAPDGRSKLVVDPQPNMTEAAAAAARKAAILGRIEQGVAHG